MLRDYSLILNSIPKLMITILFQISTKNNLHNSDKGKKEPLKRYQNEKIKNRSFTHTQISTQNKTYED